MAEITKELVAKAYEAIEIARKGGKIKLRRIPLANLPVKFLGGNFSLCISALYIGKKKILPKFFFGNGKHLGQCFQRPLHVKQNENISQIKKNGLNHKLS